MSGKTETALKQQILKQGKVPRHIAFIMDGNGRWAHRRGLPRIAGHSKGVKTVRKMVETGPEIGVEVMTFYTFSTENWNRPRFEVSALMELLLDSINNELDDLKKNDVSLRVIGDLSALPVGPREAMKRAMLETLNNKGLKLVLALNYSGRREIIQAVNRIIESQKLIERTATPDPITEEVFSSFLDTADIPDPDLMIRTSGEFRLSNFLLYQLAYTEIIVTDKYWPDFSRQSLFECIAEYQQRERRFGKTSEQLQK